MANITNKRYIGPELDTQCPNGINVTKLLKSNSKMIVAFYEYNYFIFIPIETSYNKTARAELEQWGETVIVVNIDQSRLSREYCLAFLDRRKEKIKIANAVMGYLQC